MAIFPKTRVVNHAEFQTNDDSQAARYGLPTTVNFCQRCVTSNQKPISVMRAELLKRNQPLTGKRAMQSYVHFAIDIAVLTGRMTA